MPHDEENGKPHIPLSPEDTPTRAVSSQPAAPEGEASKSPADDLTMDTSDAPTISTPPLDPPSAQSASGSGGPTFAPDNVLANRYRIVRYIAKGGMGEVYEAEDLTLKGRVALKTILPEIAKNEISVERFRREIAIARRVTHSNVSRIYDIGTHGETMFLTMELLGGEDLRTRITRGGRFTDAEALPVVEQIAAGLHAAHETGIIHRDFKSANVMLVPSASGNGERAVVTDFGLARPSSAEEGMESLSDSGAVVGTPAYMAPEQVEGAELTPAADIYALGIVLYEMLTGCRPFDGGSAFSVAVRRLTEAPPPPRTHVPDIDEKWEAVIMRCLAKDPAARFADARDITRALRSDEMPTVVVSASGTTRPSLPVATPWKPILIAAAVVLVAIVSVFAWKAWGPSAAVDDGSASNVEAQKPPVKLRNSVAVLGFHNNSGVAGAEWLSTAITEMLATELAADGTVRVAPGQEVERARADLGLSAPDSIGGELDSFGKLLGVGSVVTGSYTIVGDSGSRLLRIDVKVLDTTTGDVIATSGSSGTEVQLFDLVSRAGGGIRQKLGLGELSPEQIVAVKAALPTNAEAVKLYTEGIEKLRQLDVVGARDRLTKAAEADPDHSLTQASLSAAYSALGEEELAKEAAARAVALGESLGREQQLQIEIQMHASAKEWKKAVEAGMTLWQSFPDNVDYGLALASAQISAGQTNEALVTLKALRELPAPLSTDGRIDLAESKAHQELSDFEKQKAFARTAAEKGTTTGSRLLTARARMLEASALLALGNAEEAEAAAEDARAIFIEAGDKGGTARALELKATAVDYSGDLEGERRLLEQALAIHRELGDKLSIARVELNIGYVYLTQGRNQEADRAINQALATFREANAKYPAALALNNLGITTFYMGDLTRAEKRYQEALALFQELGDKSGTAFCLTNIAEILSSRGDLETARSMHEDSLALNRGIGDKAGEGYDLFRIGEIFAARGDFVAARGRLEQALASQDEVGDRLGAADTRAALAALTLEEGDATLAESEARKAEEVLRTEGAMEQAYAANATVANALLAQGKRDDAVAIATATWEAAQQAGDRRIRYYVAVTAARAQAASGKDEDVTAALALLETARRQAVDGGFVASSLEARLAAGEIAMSAGRANAASQLSQLEKDATAKGFLRISRKAASAKSSPEA